MRGRRGQAGPKRKENLVALCLLDLDMTDTEGTDQFSFVDLGRL